MSEMLFYQKLILIDKNTHRNARLTPVKDYRFAAGTNSVPLAGVEFPEAAKEYPIFFIETPAKTLSSIALLGLRNDENLFVGEGGAWDLRYIPAYIRRYPFVPSTTKEADQLAICIDEKYPGFNDPAGEPLFLDDGRPAPLMEKVLELVKDYHYQLKRTEVFTARLKEYELFKPVNAEIRYADGHKFNFTGLFAVDEQKLLKLNDEKALTIFRSGELSWIYSHLASITNLGRLGDRLHASTGGIH